MAGGGGLVFVIGVLEYVFGWAGVGYKKKMVFAWDWIRVLNSAGRSGLW